MSFSEMSSEAKQRYQINQPFVVHETFADEEAAIINLKTGNYYSLNPIGAEIWEIIAKNADFDSIVKYLAARYEGDHEIMRRQLRQFILNLTEQDLIVDFNGNAADFELANIAGTKAPYIAPVIEGYTDMQELLLLDPIHDVDETGFPNAKPA